MKKGFSCVSELHSLNQTHRDKTRVICPGVPLEILGGGGGVPLGSPNPDPTSDQKISFSTPVFRPGPSCSKLG